MKKKVSIIVPVYNLEESLENCLQSISNQTYKELEIILINDGSKDNSLVICKEYQKKDNRIRVFTHNNQGVSYTRNVGINVATGEYLMFVDGDDVLKSNMVENYIYYALEQNSDIVIGGLDFVRNGVTTVKKPEQRRLIRKDFLSTVCCDRSGLYGYVSNKLYRTSIIQSNCIFFDEKMYAQEDFNFALQVYEKAEIFSLISYSGYIYNYVEGKRVIPMHDIINNQIKLLSISKYNYVDKHAIIQQQNRICSMIYAVLFQCKTVSEINAYKSLFNSLLNYTGTSLEIKIIIKLFNSNKNKTILNYFKLRKLFRKVVVHK